MSKNRLRVLWVGLVTVLVAALVLFSACQAAPAPSPTPTKPAATTPTAAPTPTATTPTAKPSVSPSPSPSPSVAKAPIKIGATLPLTAAVGQGQLGGMEIAVEEANAAGGINGRPIQFIYYNDEGNTEKITANVERLITVDKVAAMTGASYSAHGIAANEVCKKYGMPLVSPTASTDALDKESLVFRIIPNSTALTNGSLAQAQRMGAKRVALLWVNSAWGVATRDIIVRDAPKYGITPAGSEAVDQGATDVTVQLTKIKAQSPDCIIAVLYDKEIIASLTGLKAIGWNVPFIDSGSIILGIIAATDPRVLEGAYTMDHTDYRKPITQKLMDAYEKKYGKRWEYGQIATGYDAIRVIVEGLKQADNPDNPTSVLNAIRKVKIPLAVGKPGAATDFTSRNWGLLAEQTQFYVIKSGKPVPVD